MLNRSDAETIVGFINSKRGDKSLFEFLKSNQRPIDTNNKEELEQSYKNARLNVINLMKGIHDLKLTFPLPSDPDKRKNIITATCKHFDKIGTPLFNELCAQMKKARTLATPTDAEIEFAAKEAVMNITFNMLLPAGLTTHNEKAVPNPNITIELSQFLKEISFVYPLPEPDKLFDKNYQGRLFTEDRYLKRPTGSGMSGHITHPRQQYQYSRMTGPEYYSNSLRDIQSRHSSFLQNLLADVQHTVKHEDNKEEAKKYKKLIPTIRRTILLARIDLIKSFIATVDNINPAFRKNDSRIFRDIVQSLRQCGKKARNDLAGLKKACDIALAVLPVINAAKNSSGRNNMINEIHRLLKSGDTKNLDGKMLKHINDCIRIEMLKAKRLKSRSTNSTEKHFLNQLTNASQIIRYQTILREAQTQNQRTKVDVLCATNKVMERLRSNPELSSLKDHLAEKLLEPNKPFHEIADDLVKIANEIKAGLAAGTIKLSPPDIENNFNDNVEKLIGFATAYKNESAQDQKDQIQTTPQVASQAVPDEMENAPQGPENASQNEKESAPHEPDDDFKNEEEDAQNEIIEQQAIKMTTVELPPKQTIEIEYLAHKKAEAIFMPTVELSLKRTIKIEDLSPITAEHKKVTSHGGTQVGEDQVSYSADTTEDYRKTLIVFDPKIAPQKAIPVHFGKPENDATAAQVEKPNDSSSAQVENQNVTQTAEQESRACVYKAPETNDVYKKLSNPVPKNELKVNVPNDDAKNKVSDNTENKEDTSPRPSSR